MCTLSTALFLACDYRKPKSSQPHRSKDPSKEGDSYRFAYKGLYCYSMARYLFENMVR